MTTQETQQNAEALAQLAAECRTRSQLYRLLSRMFRVEADQALIDAMSAMHFPVESGNGFLNDGYYRVAKFLSNTWKNTLTELAVDYARTFVGHGNDAWGAAFPFESVYVSEKRLLMQAARDEVLAIYRSEGVDKGEDWREAEDHIALEFEFMAVLNDRTVAALEQGDENEAVRLFEVQRNFHAEHLISWTPMFTTDMRRFAQTNFYLGLAALTDGFLETEAEFFDSLVEE